MAGSYKKDEADFQKHYYNLKGKKAEQILSELANHSFLQDWCFPNPHYKPGKEICDLLVVFGNDLLIWQIKDVAFTGNEERYYRKAIEEPVEQVVGAERTLLHKGLTHNFKNAYGFELTVEPGCIFRTFRLVVTAGDGDIFMPFMVDKNIGLVHVFDRSIASIMSELDTTPDFLAYLKAREHLFQSGSMVQVNGGEEELLVDYLINGKSFEAHLQYDFNMVEGGLWAEFINSESYRRKLLADRVSYAWDHLISYLHESGDPNYLEVAREMAKTNRLERRQLSELLLGAQMGAKESGKSFPRSISLNGVSYVFLIVQPNVSREKRKTELLARSIVVRDRFPENKKVIGITCECLGSPGYSYDCLLLDVADWNQEKRQLAQEVQRRFGYFKNSKPVRAHADEYPAAAVPDLIEEQIKSLGRSITSKKTVPKVGRNDPCPCGSGKKYKKCHGANEQ